MVTPKGPRAVNVEFTLERETKNTYRYTETACEPAQPEPVIGTTYVKKALFKGKAPEKISITLAWEES